MLFSPGPIYYKQGLVFIRIVVGLLMAYHGLEVFDRATMEPYFEWDVIKALPEPEFMVYLGKSLELVTGICFVLGLFTRIAALMMMGDMLFICFYVGSGRFYYQDQHPFLFAMIAFVFVFTGPVAWSLDEKLFGKSNTKDLGRAHFH